MFWNNIRVRIIASIVYHYCTHEICSGITLKCTLLRLLYTIIVRMKYVLEKH